MQGSFMQYFCLETMSCTVTVYFCYLSCLNALIVLSMGYWRKDKHNSKAVVSGDSLPNNNVGEVE